MTDLLERVNRVLATPWLDDEGKVEALRRVLLGPPEPEPVVEPKPKRKRRKA